MAWDPSQWCLLWVSLLTQAHVLNSEEVSWTWKRFRSLTIIKVKEKETISKQQHIIQKWRRAGCSDWRGMWSMWSSQLTASVEMLGVYRWERGSVTGSSLKTCWVILDALNPRSVRLLIRHVYHSEAYHMGTVSYLSYLSSSHHAYVSTSTQWWTEGLRGRCWAGSFWSLTQQLLTYEATWSVSGWSRGGICMYVWSNFSLVVLFHSPMTCTTRWPWNGWYRYSDLFSLIKHPANFVRKRS